MRILFVSHSFPVPGEPLSNVGGMQRVAVDLHRALHAHPQVELRSLLLETSWRWTGLRTPPFLLEALIRIPRIIREEKIDVVLFSSMVTASLAPLLKRRVHEEGGLLAAIPVGRDVTLPNSIYQRLVPSILKALDLVFPISRATAQMCLARGALREKVHIIPCGTKLPEPAEYARREAMRQVLVEYLSEIGFAVNREALLLLSVGRHQERKGFHWFVEHVMPRTPEATVYLLAGSGPMTDAIRQAADRSGTADRVLLLGSVSEAVLQMLYAGADVFVMPNIPVAGDIEGFGVVMVEAGAAGLPVIAADLEGIRDVITEGRNGRLLPTGDATAFASAVEAYRDPQRLQAASTDSAEHVRDHFGWAAIADMYVAVLQKRSSCLAEEPASVSQHR